MPPSSFIFTAEFLRLLKKLDIYLPETENQFYFDVIDITNRLKHRPTLKR